MCSFPQATMLMPKVYYDNSDGKISVYSASNSESLNGTDRSFTLNGLVPEYLSSKFLKRRATRYSPRDSENKLLVPPPLTNYRIYSNKRRLLGGFLNKPLKNLLDV